MSTCFERNFENCFVFWKYFHNEWIALPIFIQIITINGAKKYVYCGELTLNIFSLADSLFGRNEFSCISKKIIVHLRIWTNSRFTDWKSTILQTKSWPHGDKRKDLSRKNQTSLWRPFKKTIWIIKLSCPTGKKKIIKRGAWKTVDCEK